MANVRLCLMLVALHFAITNGAFEKNLGNVCAVMPDPSCSAAASNRPCPTIGGFLPQPYPTNYTCPCIAATGGAITGHGTPSQANTDINNFEDIAFISSTGDPNFRLLTDVAFTDNTREAFITAKAGFVYYYNLYTNNLTLWLDITSETDNTGDKGLLSPCYLTVLSIETHPDFAQYPYVYMWYTVNPNKDPTISPYTASWQRLIRYKAVNSVVDLTSRTILLGQDQTDGPCQCFDSHAGGTLAFGWDGSLFVSTGEGAHWDWAEGDFGQIESSYDAQCPSMCGNQLAIGAFRSQVTQSLNGKILRLDPMTGKGICDQSSGFSYFNPYCSQPDSLSALVWAEGLRNPFRMTVRPPIGDEASTGFPGVVYIGDVGDGLFEEINVVTRPGMNFGWPCWEGPLPNVHVGYSSLNTDTSVPHYTINGQPLNCPYIFTHNTVDMPFYYYTRVTSPSELLYNQNSYLGQGFNGNAISGLSFYTGITSDSNTTPYPDKYKNTLWVSDYGYWWIRIFSRDSDDNYVGVQDFSEYNEAIITVKREPYTGNMCYIDYNGGVIHMIVYHSSNLPPEVQISASITSGAVPLSIQFSSDGTQCKDQAYFSLQWDFGDGDTSTMANPTHTYNQAGIYNVTLTAVQSNGLSASASITIYAEGVVQPLVQIVSPVSHAQIGTYSTGGAVTFSAAVTPSNPNYKYEWNVNLVHINHISYTAGFTVDVSSIGADSHGGDRVSYQIVLYVSVDSTTSSPSYTITSSDSISLISPQFSDSSPSAVMAVSGSLNVGQPIYFDAHNTTDPDLDYLWYLWIFGDGYNATGVATTHIYEQSGTYDVTLIVNDNWNKTDTKQTSITIDGPLPPPSTHDIQNVAALSASSSFLPSFTFLFLFTFCFLMY